MNIRKKAIIAMSIIILGIVIGVIGVSYSMYNVILGDGELSQTVIGVIITMVGIGIASAGARVKMPGEK